MMQRKTKWPSDTRKMSRLPRNQTTRRTRKNYSVLSESGNDDDSGEDEPVGVVNEE